MRQNAARIGAMTVGLAVTLLASEAIKLRPDEALARPLDTIPTVVDGWSGSDDPPMQAGILASLDASSYLSRTYRRGADAVNLFIAYYANQRAGESMHSPKHCLPGSGWEFLSYGKRDLRVGDQMIRVNEDLVGKDGGRMSLLYWYQSRRRVIASEYTAKLWLIRDAIFERRAGGAIVRVTCSEPGDAGREFAAAVFPWVNRAIGGGE